MYKEEKKILSMKKAIKCGRKGKKGIPKLKACEVHSFSQEEIFKIQSSLLTWYMHNQRSLPWRDIARNEKDPNKRGYSVWVSEVMLQQTQVATVINYYKRWIEKWPSLDSLSKADLEEICKTWAGLGYYSRARRLHEGSQKVMVELNGQFPQTADKLLELIPGIGQYTAAAIASIAYGQIVGVVDGNVSRVLSRLRIIGGEISKPAVTSILWQLADILVCNEHPGDFNQALMELGATVCRPQNPQCNLCPLKMNCLAYSKVQTVKKQFVEKLDHKNKNHHREKIEDTETSPAKDIEEVPDCFLCIPPRNWNLSLGVSNYPCKPQKKPSRREVITVLVVEHCKEQTSKNGAILMVKRPPKGLLAGLWEFPSVLLESEERGKKHDESVKNKLKELKIPTRIISHQRKVGEVIHIFSHIHTTYVVEHLIIKEQRLRENEKLCWMMRSEIKEAAISTAMKKVLNAVDSVVQTEKTKRKRNCEEEKSSHLKKSQITITKFLNPKHKGT